jgi:hypothetical protein
MDVKFNHCTAIHKGQAYLYYIYDKALPGYFITSIAIADTMEAKRNFSEVLEYFFIEIVRDRATYCNLFENSVEFFSKYVTTSQQYNDMTVYKMKKYKDIVK